MSKENTTFEKQAQDNLKLSPKKMDAFLKQARALRRNLSYRKKQQQERKEKCMPSK